MATNTNGTAAAVTAQPAAAGVTAAAPTPAAAAARAQREQKRLALRSANVSLWAQGDKRDAPSSTLDSALKKNTAFVTKLRAGLLADAKEAILKSLGTLRVEKYVEEIVQAVPEGLGKCTKEKDVGAAGEIISALHARFPPSLFAYPLAALLASLVAPPNQKALAALSAETRERDEAARLARQKVLLRGCAELALIEVVRAEPKKGAGAETEAGAEWLFSLLKELLSTDREHANVPVLTALLKGIGSTLLGPPSSTAAASTVAPPAPQDEAAFPAIGATAPTTAAPQVLLSVETQARFRKLCETYFSTLSKRIVREHERLQDQDKRNHEAYIRSGEIFEDRQQAYEKMTKSFERLLEGGKGVSDLLGVPLPRLTDSSRGNGIGLAINLDAKSSLLEVRDDETFASGKSAWEDEDTRRFYEDIIDLGEMVPLALLGGAAQATTWEKEEGTTDEAVAEGADAVKEDGGLAVAPSSQAGSPATSPLFSPMELDAPTSPSLPAEELAPEVKPSATTAEEKLPAGPHAQLGALLARLPEMTNRTMIDSAVVEFAFLNSKAARNRLIKHLGSVPRNRSDLLPYYARFIGTLNRYIPEIGAGVIAILHEEFRYFQRKRLRDLAESRSKNLRYIAELTKFRVTPIHTIFYCFKVCLDDFSGPNIENLATLLESCGRFLLRTSETADRTRSMLEMLRRKRAAQNLDHRQVMMLDNAYYQCNPPERKAIEAKKRTPMELYIRHLIYDELSKRTLDRVLKLLRKLHWDDKQVVQWLHEAFTRSWRIKFSNVHLLAILVHDLQPYHPEFTVGVVDAVCEQVRSGMELNNFKLNQRRVATIAYLGELYNYRLINDSVIFEQLWSLTTFGHAQGRALPGQVSRVDAPDDYFRIRLICTLLDTCGQCFERGLLAKRLDEFLLILNTYTLSKEQPLPMDSDFMLLDTLEALRPRFELKRNFEEAARAVDEMLAKQRAAEVVDQQPPVETIAEDEDAEEGSGDETDGSESAGEGEEGPAGVRAEEDEASSGAEDEGDAATIVEEEEDEDDLMRRDEGEDAADAEAEDEFERELAKMMAESSSSNAGGSRVNKPLFDAGIPIIRKPAANAAQQMREQVELASRVAGSAPAVPDGSHMKFSLLSRKGNKQQTHDVQVPIDSAIAVHTRSKQLRDQAEREQLKQLVLSYEGREEAEQRLELEQALKSRGIKLTYADGG